MREMNKIAEGLFEKIRDRFEDVSLGDDNAKATTDPEKARFFNFDYVVDDTDHGNITMSLIDETSLKVYFSKNISDDLDKEQKKKWYSFLRELREFARTNLLSFEPRDITRSTLKHRDIQQQSKADSTYDADEVVAESRMYGTLNRSYESFGPVRIKLQHTKPIMDETHGARSRNIAAVFVENDQGERFRLPFENLTGARAMARHVSAGGVPTDDLGRHITEMVSEMTTLRPFVRGMARRTFEDTVTKEMVESAFGYHALLKNTLKKLKGKRGYTEFKESFKPALVEDEVNIAELKELFVKKTLDERIEQALPLVHKAYTIMKENNNPYAQQFENWADKLSEGSWALPDTDDEVDQLIEWLSEEHPVGVDAQDATNSLYNIIGDDRLFDRLGELAKTDPTADARDVVTSWLYDNLPQVYQRIESEIGDPDYPAEPAEDGEQEVDESYTPPPVMINGKQVDLRSIELDGVESWDQPDYADAYASAATFTDGTALTDDELEELSDKHGDIINMRAHDMLEAKDDDYDTKADQELQDYENEVNLGDNDSGDKDPKEQSRESAQASIIRRIIHSHSDLLMAYGPKAITNAVEEYAYNLDDLEEIGTSDVSIWVQGVIDLLGEMDMQKDDDREEYQQHHAGNDTENDPQVRNTEFEESKDKVTYDPKTGKLTGWEHEGDWKKQTKKKDPVGKVHHMSDVARRRTEKMTSDETLEETFERLVNEGVINVGDMIRDKTQPEISGKVVLDMDENYIIQVEDDQYHILKLNAEKVAKEAIEMPDNPDYSGYDKPTFQRKGIVPGQPNKTLPGMNDKKKPGWVGVDTTKPAYQRQADYEQEREQMKKLAGLQK